MRPAFGPLVRAACALPGILATAAVLGPAPARADEAPEQGVFELKLSGYQDGQTAGAGTNTASSSSLTQRARAQGNALHTVSAASASSGGGSTGGGSTGSTGSSNSGGGDGGLDWGLDLVHRVRVTSPSVYALLPVGRQWSVEGSATVDAVSGASPSYYTDTGSFTSFKDTRRAADARLTRYFDRQVLALGLSTSHESDYVSNALSLDGRWSTPDQNTTFNLGLGLTHDRINPSNAIVVDARKTTREFQLGVTQAVNARDLVQAGYTRSLQSGYLDDPYKSWDQRPDRRDAQVLQLRWNHALAGSALKTGYRFYRDSWGIRSHTLDLAWAIPVGASGRSQFSPTLRWATQNAARFYVDPNSASATYPAPSTSATDTTLDQRLAAWGALTVGGKYEWPLDRDWTMDSRLEVYRQQAGLRLIGEGSPGLAPLTALIWQVGVQRRF